MILENFLWVGRPLVELSLPSMLAMSSVRLVKETVQLSLDDRKLLHVCKIPFFLDIIRFIDHVVSGFFQRLVAGSNECFKTLTLVLLNNWVIKWSLELEHWV